MTTTDTDALKERIARAFYENRVAAIESDQERRSWPAWEDHEKADADEWRDAADAVLPIVAAEVRKAKAEALREAAENVDVGSLVDSWTHGAVTGLSVTNAVAEVLMSLRNRATEYETGGSDDRR